MAEQLTDLLEGTLARDVEEAALEHLASCPACEQVLAETQAAIAVVGEYGRAPLDEKAREHLLGAVIDDVGLSHLD